MLRPSLVLLSILTITACSGSSTSTGGDGGTSDGGDGGGGGQDSGGQDSGGGGPLLNGCTAYADQSATTAARKIEWDLAVAASPSRCMTVKKGQTVAFEGNFTDHPLGPAGGDTPNPFDQVADTGKVTFTAVGTFGFVCGIHASMTGAIQVIE